MLPRVVDAYRVLPELVWCGFGVLAMLMQPFVCSRHFFTFLALIGTVAGTAASVTSAMHAGPGFEGLVQSDSFSFFFRLLVGTVAFLVVLVAEPYLDRERLPCAEFYALLLFATAGMGVLASAQELLTAFIGLEMSSISSYILAGYRRDSLKSTESAMKYFLLGSFATAFFLYGIALVYGSSGTTMLTRMGSEELLDSPLFELGLAMILIGLGFKVAAAPFQVWTPDVYEGAPTPVTALFSGAEGRSVRAAAAHFRHGACGDAVLVLGLLGARGADDVCRQPRRTGADEHEAAAGVQLDRARRIHFGRLCRRHLHGERRVGGSGAGLCGGIVLPPELRAGETGRVHDRFAARRLRRKESFA